MGASTLMSVAMKGMAASYANMQTTGHNITNASVEGYSRQRVQLATSQGQFTGAGFFGKGVDVVTVTRDFNAFLAKEAASTKSLASYDEARSEQLDSLQNVFLGGDDGLGAQLGSFLNSFVDVASRPQDLAARQVVLAQAQALASRFSSAVNQIDSVQQGVEQALANAVTQVNELTTQIAAVNDRIAKLKGSEHSPNDLLDQRNRLINELSGFLPITTLDNPNDNTVSVFVAGGQRLVLGSIAQDLALGTDDYDSSRYRIEIVEADGPHPLESDALNAGSIGGLLRFQNDDLVRARSLVGQLAYSLASAVNAQQLVGQDLSGTTGTDFFDLGQVGQVLPGKGNTLPVTVTMTVDPTVARAAEYELYNDGTNWLVTERPGGTPRVLDTNTADGIDPIDGMTIDLGSPPPAPNQRFLLQPVARAADGMTALISDPRRVAAAQGTSENANALALVALRDGLQVGRLQDPSTFSISGGSTFTDAWASAMADIGVRVQGAQTATEISGSMADTAKKTLESVSGVNLDEEAAQLLQFQQSYQACAKVLQIAQQVFQELLSVAGN